MTIARATGDVWSTAFALRTRGSLLLHQAQLASATADLSQSLDLFRTVGDDHNAAIALAQLGWAEWQQRDAPRAVALLRESLALGISLKDPRALTIAASVAGWMAAEQGGAEDVARTLAAVEVLRAANGILYLPGERAAQIDAQAVLSTRLATVSLARTSAEGQAWSAEQAADTARVVLDQIVAPAERIPETDKRRRTRPSNRGNGIELSERETEVLRRVAQGLSNKQIAAVLNLSERTIKAHLTTALNKLAADNRAQAAVLATQRGLV